MNPLLRRAVAAIRQWQPFAPGLEAGETTYCAHGWQAPRRLVVVRELLDERPEARGRKLLEVPGYTFHVLVTTLGHDPVATWRFSAPQMGEEKATATVDHVRHHQTVGDFPAHGLGQRRPGNFKQLLRLGEQLVF